MTELDIVEMVAADRAPKKYFTVTLSEVVEYQLEVEAENAEDAGDVAYKTLDEADGIQRDSWVMAILNRDIERVNIVVPV